MTVHLNEGDSVRGIRLTFQGRRIKLGKGTIQLTKTHKGKRGTIDSGECWIEKSIKSPNR